MRTSLPILVATVALVGCSNSALDGWDRAKINDADDALYWSQGSAPQLYGGVGLLLTAMVQAVDEAATADGCPTRETSGNKIIYRGGCTGEAGTWRGTLTSEGAEDEDEEATFRFENFGYSRDGSCDNGQTEEQRLNINGVASFSNTNAPGVTRFEFDLSIEQRLVADETDCTVENETAAYDYTGTRTEDGSRVTFNGSGRFGTETLGVMNVSTDDEVVDTSACSTEALSGTTRLEGEGTVAVLTYDGATDCSEDSTVTWTLNGEEMGTLSGVTCASASGAPLWWAAAGLVLLVLRRRGQSSSSGS